MKHIPFTTFFLITFLTLIIPNLPAQQSKILSRNNTSLPESFLKNIENEHRKLINLDGEWDITCSDPNINTKVQVPFCYDFRAPVFCKRSFSLQFDNPGSYNYIIYCDGVNYQCEISINDRFIVKHEGGYTQFSSIIQDGTIKEENHIDIKMDNYLDNEKTLPLRNINNYPKNYGGIYRDIYILAVPKVFIKGVNVSSEIDINFNADIKNTITITSTDITSLGNEKNLTVKTELLDSSGNVKAASNSASLNIAENSSVQAQNNISLNDPQYWSPEHPYLYTLRVTISAGTNSIDIYRLPFGVYEFAQKTSSIIMNKTELTFKGINYIEEFPGTGICGNYKDIEKDIQNIKTLGCNAIKVYSRQASPYLIEICNRMGVLILEELPVFNVPASLLTDEYYTSLAENQLNEMILSHKNNPCIFAYGLGNDFNVSVPESRTFIGKLAALGKSLDKRLIYYSTRNYFNDICRNLVDMTGINYYDPDLKTLKDIISDTKLKKEKIFLSSYGKLINPTNFSGYSDPSSIESQSKYIVDTYKLVKGSTLDGSFFFSYADWHSDYPNLITFDKNNQYLKTTGLFTLNRDQRSSYVILKKVYFDEDIPNLNIGTFGKDSPIIFVVLGIPVFILFIYLANSIRRFRENVWRALFRPFIFFTDVREQNLIQTMYNVLLAIILSIGNGIFFASLFYFWKDTHYLDMILSVVITNEPLKIFLDPYIVNPLKLTLLFAVLTFIKLFVISIVIWLFSLTLKFRVLYKNIYTITVWGFLPTISLLILGTFYYRIISENHDFLIIGLIFAGIVYLISIYRIIKGTYIIFDTMFLKAYVYAVLTIALIYGSMWFYLNKTRLLSDYFKLVFAFLKN